MIGRERLFGWLRKTQFHCGNIAGINGVGSRDFDMQESIIEL